MSIRRGCLPFVIVLALVLMLEIPKAKIAGRKREHEHDYEGENALRSATRKAIIFADELRL